MRMWLSTGLRIPIPLRTHNHDKPTTMCNCNDIQQCRREPTIEEHVRDLSKRLTDLTSRLFALENTVNTKKTDPIAMWDKIPPPDGSVGIVVEVRDSALLIRRQP